MEENKGPFPLQLQYLLFIQHVPWASLMCLFFAGKSCVISLNLETKTTLRDKDHSLIWSPSQAVPDWAQVRPLRPQASCLQTPPWPYGSLSPTLHLSGDLGNWVCVIAKYNFPALSLDPALLWATKAYFLPECKGRLWSHCTRCTPKFHSRRIYLLSNIQHWSDRKIFDSVCLLALIERLRGSNSTAVEFILKNVITGKLSELMLSSL